MNTNHDALREALEPFAKLFRSLQSDFDGPLPTTFDATISTEDVRRAAYALSQPPAPEQASGELVASADCPLCGKDTPHGHGTEDIAEWLRIQARRFVGANADDLIRINTSEVHLIDSLRRQIQELEHRVESLTPETSYENYGKSDAELKALFATTKEEATHNGIEFLMHGKNMAFKIGNQMFTLAHEPDEPGDFEFMKGALLHALSTITPDVNVTFLAKLDQANTKDAIAQAVDRFLGWKLPQDFAPDCGISFAPLGHPNGWPTGTNLFTAVQARQMLEYMLSASPTAPEATKSAYTKALEIRTAQGWKLTGEAIPVLYTDTINDQQVMRDDVWLCTTAALRQSEAAKPEPQAQAGEPIPENCDVRKILVAVIPDMEGDPVEVYAESVADVEERMGEMGRRLEDYELGITVPHSIREAIAQYRAALQACVDGLQKARDWHKGDKWREGAPTERAAWESHRDMLDAAITQAEEAVGRSAL